MFSSSFWEELWYTRNKLCWILLPLSLLFILASVIRKYAYRAGLLPVQRVDVPVIVVGNITVGGTGKTPLIIWLVEYLKELGYKPGVISRGYGGQEGNTPQQVRADSFPELVGDEPVLIAQRTEVPVAVSPKRYLAARELIQHKNCDIILSDDGLQHYGLHRDIEIAVIDGKRLFGNGFRLPAGPLREHPSRLRHVDMIVNNGSDGKNQHKMEYKGSELLSLKDDHVRKKLDKFTGRDVHAIAGIGNPESFFTLLKKYNLRVVKHAFPDHYQYHERDFSFEDDLPIIMTEKDAVKCREYAKDNFWYLPIEADLSNTFEHRFQTILKEIENG